MRSAQLLSATLTFLLCACGSGGKNKGGDDDARPADAAADAAPDAGPSCTPRRGTRLTATQVATDVELSLLVASPPGDPTLYAVQHFGTIRRVEAGRLASPAFLDLSEASGGPVRAGSERGLLGLAFHPRFAENHKFYVFYSTGDGRDQHRVLAEFTAGADLRAPVDPGTQRILIDVTSLFGSHYGGMLQFGADGYLYVGFGDGGGTGDPYFHAQNLQSLLGKLLRLDVDHPSGAKPYGIPADNPFADGVGGLPEIYAYGLRNPWRWSLDRATGDFYVGDVGQDLLEEISVVSAAQLRGANFGWSQYEGSSCYREPCDPAGKVMPVLERNHVLPSAGGDGYCAIIGGSVYRGSCFPDLVGRYFYSDYCAGNAGKAPSALWSFVWDGASATSPQVHPMLFPRNPNSITMDAFGELYVTADGEIYHLEATE
ncbi:MAG: PQQ-dependent sugar dehydrogenase [Kofleriaceae bacterium]